MPVPALRALAADSQLTAIALAEKFLALDEACGDLPPAVLADVLTLLPADAGPEAAALITAQATLTASFIASMADALKDGPQPLDVPLVFATLREQVAAAWGSGQ